jgi:hypothetical protein
MAKDRSHSGASENRPSGRSLRDHSGGLASSSQLPVPEPPVAELPAHEPTGEDNAKVSAISPADIERSTLQMRQLAWLMDESIPIPWLGTRVGIDGLLGLIPGVGDLISAGIASYIIRQAHLLGVPRVVLLRMTLNTAVDFVIGAVPFLGDLFDFAWKANRRNVRLVLEHLENPRRSQRVGWLSIAGMLAGLVVLGAAVMWAVSGLWSWLVA